MPPTRIHGSRNAQRSCFFFVASLGRGDYTLDAKRRLIPLDTTMFWDTRQPRREPGPRMRMRAQGNAAGRCICSMYIYGTGRRRVAHAPAAATALVLTCYSIRACSLTQKPRAPVL